MMIVIIACNFRQAREFALEHRFKPSEYIIAFSEDKIRGLRNVVVYRVGEYWLNPINDSEYLSIKL